MKTMQDLALIYQPIEDDLARTKEVLAQRLKSARGYPLREINRYILDALGKRIRPALVLFSHRLASQDKRLKDKEEERVIHLAAAVELIHMASLLHDDVIDRARLRRNRPTVNARWGLEVAIATGDYLYSNAFDMIASLERPDISACIAQATAAMCEGELVQVKERKNFNLTRGLYFYIITKKTASLMAACCQGAGLLVGIERKKERALAKYGLNFGIAFQIMDDYMDLMGGRRSLGKEPLTDIKVGELTLPILNLKRYVLDSRILASRNGSSRLKRLLLESNAGAKTKEEAASFARRAQAGLRGFEDSKYKSALLGLADFMIDR